MLRGYLGVANVYALNDSKTRRFFHGRKLWSMPSHVNVDGFKKRIGIWWNQKMTNK
jgi:hypothetical protein